MSDSTDRVVVVFTEAIELPADERAAYLERACVGDAKLRKEVDAMLAIQDSVGDFLEQPAHNAPNENRPGAFPIEKAGDRIGRYKLLRQIGEGGCGVVYMAEQEEPIRRRIALKIIKPGMDTKNVIARFEAERQALALMDHPNIAKVLDAGATASGRPFFVMELVRGNKITEYCDQHSLTTDDRLKLFIRVCQAVQHAHQKGIIHRDLKPSNILVATTEEGAALPVVIDFGIAKATTNLQLTNKTVSTALEMLIGTPAYMSPEQAELTSGDVDTRTDIYSLGVLLYELLTGSPPFDTDELLEAGLDEVRRVIREQEPVRPSTRLSTMIAARLNTVSLHRKSEPPKLIRSVAGDLDWIVMKALEKDRTRRYDTANGLALDVKRFLANETISAHPPSKLYKLKKLMLRNQLLFLGIGILALLLVVSLLVVSASLRKEQQARHDADLALQRAQADKAKAETESAKSRQVTHFLEEILRGVSPSVALGEDTRMLQGILDRTVERIGKEMTNQPAVEAELRNVIGTIYRQMGNFGRAEEMHRTALKIRRKLFGPNDPALAQSLNDLALELQAENKLSEAEAAFREALAIRQRLFGRNNADTATSINDLAAVYRDEGKHSEADALAREALAIRQGLFGSTNLAVADSLRNLSINLGSQGKWAESEATARKVLAIRRILLGPEHPWIATALNDVAWAAGNQGKLEEAEMLQREALAMRRKLLPEEHPDVAASLYLVGDRMRQQGNLKEASSLLGVALSIQRRVLGEASPATLDTLRSLGMTLEAEGKLAESEAMHRQAVALWRNRGEGYSWGGLTELEDLLHILIIEKKFGEAEQILDEALTAVFVNQPSSANLLSFRVDLKARRGLWPEALADATLASNLQPFNHDRLCVLAALLARTQNRAAYDQLCKKLLTEFRDTTNAMVADSVAKSCLFLPGSESDLKAIGRLADAAVRFGSGDAVAMPFFEDGKAMFEYRRGHFAEAIEWAQKPLQIPGLYVHGHAYAVLAMAYWQLGRKDEGRAMLAKGNALAPRLLPSQVAEDPGNAWLAWLFARIALDEATSLIEPESTSDGSPNGH